MAALDELTAAWQEAMADEAFTGEFQRMLVEYAGVPSLLYDATQLSEQVGRPDPAQARGPQPHRRAQDPQRARPGAADQAHGQDPDDRGDRGRPARRRDGHRRGVPRPGLHRLHGRGRHRAAGAQRRPDAAARRRGDPGDLGLAHPQGRHQRGDPRLGRQRRPHGVLLRHGRRPAPLPRDGARLLPRHRRRGPRAVPRADRRAARRGRSPASAAAPTRSGIFTAFLDDEGVDLLRPRARRRRRRHRRGTPPPSGPARSGCCTAPAPTCSRTRTARPWSPTRSPPASTTRASARSTPTSRTSAGRRTARSPTPPPWRRWRCSRAPRGSSRPSSRPTRSPGRSSWPRSCPGTTILVNLSGRGDKDMGTAIEWFGLGQAAADGTPEPATEEQIAEGAK